MRRTESVDLRGNAVLASVFRYFVHGLHVDVEGVAVLVGQLDGLIGLASNMLSDKASEDAYAMVYMYDVVAYLELAQLAKSYALLLAAHAVVPERETLKTLKDLVVGIKAKAQALVDEAAMERQLHLRIIQLAFALSEDGAETLQLPAIV